MLHRTAQRQAFGSAPAWRSKPRITCTRAARKDADARFEIALRKKRLEPRSWLPRIRAADAWNTSPDRLAQDARSEGSAPLPSCLPQLQTHRGPAFCGLRVSFTQAASCLVLLWQPNCHHWIVDCMGAPAMRLYADALALDLPCLLSHAVGDLKCQNTHSPAIQGVR